MAIDAAARELRKIEAAEGYLLLSMPSQALRELRHVTDPTALQSFDWHSLHGEARRQLDQFDEAIKSFHIALDWRPDDARILSGMAWCLKRTGDLKQATKFAEAAYQADPDQAVLLYNVACYHCLAGDKPQTLSWLGRALRMDPSLRRLIKNEPDFDLLRDDADFKFIVHATDREAS